MITQRWIAGLIKDGRITVVEEVWQLSMLSPEFTDLLPKQISFKHTLQLWRAFTNGAGCSDTSLDDLCRLVAGIIVGNRLGRIEPRRVKRRPKPYSLLNEPRALARKKVRKFGHPKKA